MRISESTAKLVSALAKAQSKFDKIVKDRVGQEGNIKFPYSSLPTVLAAILPYLNEQNIFLSQPIQNDPDGTPRVTTRLQLDEEFMQSDGVRLTNQVAGKQLGKEITYGRRIDLCSFLALVGEEDEDAPDLKPAEKTGYPKTQKSVNNPALAQTKDDPLPREMYDGVPVHVDNPLPSEAQKVAEEMENFVALSDQRNTQIQDRLKQLITDKLVDRRKLSIYLDKQHDGKKALDVHANTWESTMKNIEDAVTGGPEAIKKLLKGDQ